MKVFLLADKWCVTEAAVYYRLKKIGLTYKQIRSMTFDEINTLYELTDSWRVYLENTGYLVSPKTHRPFFIELVINNEYIKDLEVIRKKITCIRISHYKRKQEWYEHKQENDKHTFKTKDFTLLYTGKHFKDIFYFASALKKGLITNMEWKIV